MFSFLKKHPFTVEAFFEHSVVLTFAVPKAQLEAIIPECLALDTFQDQWAFVAIALVQTKGLRPKGFPIFMGNDFFLIGYRIFVRYTNNAGKRLRGLYILKSETDKRKMEYLGNLFTQYNYSTTDITQQQTPGELVIQSKQSDFRLAFREITIDATLPQGSPFADWKEARQFAGPLPNTFTYDAQRKEVLIIEGLRKNWTPKPLQVFDYHFAFLETLPIEKPILANAFIMHNIPYTWKKGRTEIWKP